MASKIGLHLISLALSVSLALQTGARKDTSLVPHNKDPFPDFALFNFSELLHNKMNYLKSLCIQKSGL